MIHLFDSHPTPQQFSEMLEELEDYVKLAVDIEQGMVAGGGALHADCEAALLANGSLQENIWGADWIPRIREVRYESFINIRPRQNNPALAILDPATRSRVEEIVKRLFERV
ncbi:MAG: DUF5674 family protein [Blastocatellia bacterium]